MLTTQKTYLGYQTSVVRNGGLNITGDPQAGNVLAANNATAVQWMADGVDIGSATNLTYTVQAGDVGKQITARSTSGVIETSNALTALPVCVPPAVTLPPLIVGTPARGIPLTINAATFTGTSPIIWRMIFASAAPQSTIVAQGLAASTTYTPTIFDVGRTFVVVDIATNAAGSVRAVSPHSLPCLSQQPVQPTTGSLLFDFSTLTGVTTDNVSGAVHEIVTGGLQGTTQLRLAGNGIMRTDAEIAGGQTDVVGTNGTLYAQISLGTVDPSAVGVLAALVSRVTNPRPDTYAYTGHQLTLTRTGNTSDVIGCSDSGDATTRKRMPGRRLLAVHVPTQATNSVAAGSGAMTARVGINQSSPYCFDGTIDAVYSNVVTKATICVTGDDAYATHAALARKCAALGIPFTMYVPFGTTNAMGTSAGADNSGTGGANTSRMSYPAARALKAELGPLLDIQGNTMNDVSINSFASDQALIDDVAAMRAKATAEGFDGNAIKHYAYSNGASSASRIAALRTAGILSARCTEPPSTGDGNNLHFGYLDQSMMLWSLGFATSGTPPAAQTTTPSAATAESIIMAQIRAGRHISIHFHDTGPAVSAIGCLDSVVDAVLAVIKREMDLGTVDALTVTDADARISARTLPA